MDTYIDRRLALRKIVGSIACLATMTPTIWAAPAKAPQNKSPGAWLEEVLSTKSFDSPLKLGRFADPIYYLLEPFTWDPKQGNDEGLRSVTVPRGFVTDMASVPRVFFSLFRPDGDYAQAAIVHDYLYWDQGTLKEVADETFRKGMEDLEVSKFDEETLFQAVKRLGQSAWDGNRKLKEQGEKRILTKFPDKANVRWTDYKKDPSVFAT